MGHKKKLIKVAIDSEASAGGGTQAKLISKTYNLFYLDTGKIYRLIAFYKFKYSKKFSYNFIKNKIKKIKIKDFQNDKLLSEEIGTNASIIAKDPKINYTKKDIARNHGTEELGQKLLKCLVHILDVFFIKRALRGIDENGCRVIALGQHNRERTWMVDSRKQCYNLVRLTL